ncbi:hypothetical protein KDW_47080 [Dictyobacter vulcani]|uniref:AAA+ ATPase domain-containing protein n=1 Tax=Dictyobacter vulcani TaxID=2607529 RepID=A0A5J4KZB1_9CHLR|nr:AAA family ATPase [Dictyobacter vulcani]GER90546.1 hypothetical protein KDW_47080 [Dictyobacter vulcani]
MAKTFNEIVTAYLADHDYIEGRKQKASLRDANLPALHSTVQSFVQAEISLKTLMAQLTTILHNQEDWGATGFGFMMEMNKLNKYHNDDNSNAEIHFRNSVKGLSSANLGQHIEAFYYFLLQERERLRRAGKSSGMIIPPTRSAFIMSLFARWLDPTHPTCIYYESLRKGIYTLVQAGLLPQLPKSMFNANNIEIKKADEHREIVRLLEFVSRQAPELVQSHYWDDAFFSWVGREFHTLSSDTPTLIIKDADNSDILTGKTGQLGVIKDPPGLYETSVHQPNTATDTDAPAETLLIEHIPLKPTPEPLLTELIHRVQQHILVDEKVVRRIYYALLAGHVILTGPPGTGKTELARIIPEILWQSQASPNPQSDTEDDEQALAASYLTDSAYTTRLVTATDDWSTRTLISGIMPQSQNGILNYTIQFGHLTSTILNNWSFQGEKFEEWSALSLLRTRLTTHSGIDRTKISTFRGQWLVIDEFNRAPIDLAFGDALTALGGNEVLRVTLENGSAELPIPQDFRIIGTLNSFDRSYLNQISEALKRRFSFVEILPPTRAQSQAEQGIVLYKALKKVAHLSAAIEVRDDNINWNSISVSTEPDGSYSILWEEENNAFQTAFAAAWRVFEIIRIYRQLGTAQAINLLRHMLIAGILQNYNTHEQWISEALDAALCDTIADQLQVLLPDEIEALLLYLTTPADTFPVAYTRLLDKLNSMPQRLYSQLLSLASVTNPNGHPFLTAAQVEQLANQDRPEVPATILTGLFQLQPETDNLPQFTRRLRSFKAERGL